MKHPRKQVLAAWPSRLRPQALNPETKALSLEPLHATGVHAAEWVPELQRDLSHHALPQAVLGALQHQGLLLHPGEVQERGKPVHTRAPLPMPAISAACCSKSPVVAEWFQISS